MRVMVLVKATESSEAGRMPSEQLMADMTKFNEELVAAGILRAGEGLKPTAKGMRVRFSGKERMVTKGPFAETNELVAGYWLWEVESVEQALEWVKRCPNPMVEDSEIEIRPLYEMEDFAEADPEGAIRDRETSLTQTVAAQQSSVQAYLFFGGRCEEALEFYKESLGARLGLTMRFSECPEPMPEGAVPKGFENKIMHAEFTVGNVTLMASDGCGDAAGHEGFRLALTVPTQADAKRVFDKLTAEGKVDMPLGETFWSPCFGMATDKFGIGWMVMIPDPKAS